MIKEKLRIGSLFYKIYLYYYLFLREKFFVKRESYSQFGEDLVIKNFFKNKIGKYVDIGCFNPIKYNNTCLLYNEGWSGLNIDLNSTSIDLFKIARKKDLNIVACVSEVEGLEVEVFFDSNFSPLNSINKENLEKFNIQKYTTYKVKTKKFSNLVNFNFDFLNIDCEGEDYKVLKSIDLTKYTPQLICIEANTEKNKKLIYEYLLFNNYEFLERKGPSHIFERVSHTSNKHKK